MIPGFPGPKDHWEVELEKTSKSGLIGLIDTLFVIYCRASRETLLKMAKDARRIGRFEDAMKRGKELNADPDRYFAKKRRQREGAKKAARRRKKECKSK